MMAQNLPLGRYSVIETRDFDEARQSIARYFWEHRLDMNGEAGRFDTRFNHAPIDRTSLNFIRYGADLTVDAGEPPECYMLKFVLSGGLTVFRGRKQFDAAPGEAVLTGPDQYLHLRFTPGTDILVYKVPSALMNCRAGLLHHGDGTRHPAFKDGALPMDGTRGSLARAVHLLRREFDTDASLVRADLCRSDYEELLMGALLRSWPVRGSDSVPSGPQPAAVRRAIGYMEARRTDAVRIADLVRVSGLGESALHTAFKDHTGATPMQYLRRLRLEEARGALRDPGDGRSITDIALDCGFSHLGRFSAFFRQMYGETPTEARRSALH